MSRQTILILGGGVGGITVANSLRAKLASEHRIILVDRKTEHVFSPSLLWVMVGKRRPSQITRELHRLVRPGVEIVVAMAQDINVDARSVKTSNGDLSFDYLVVALGADLAPEVLPGFRESARTPYDLDGSEEIWKVLQHFSGGRVTVFVHSAPYKCPAAPYEIALLLDDYLRKQGRRNLCELDVYTPEALPMGVAGPEMGQAVVSMLKAKEVSFHPEVKLTRIDSERTELLFDNHESVPSDLLVGVPPHRPPVVVKESALSNDAGWIPVDRRSLQTRYQNIYAIGDVTAVSLANGKPLPKAGVFAEGEGQTVARRIADEIEHGGTQENYDGLGFCWIETGGGSAGFASGDFYAEPDPNVSLPRSGRVWHWGKILFEKYWLGTGLTRATSRTALRAASKFLGVKTSL